MTDVRDIVADWLRLKGFDGLYDPGEPCGCSREDLAPCSLGEIPERCEPAFAVKDCGTVGCEYDCTAHGLQHFGPRRETDER